MNMRFGLILFLFTFYVSLAFGQHKHKMDPYFKDRYKKVKLTKSKRRVICPGNNFSKYPYQGIGIKLGDPFAITYKIYMSPKSSFVMDYGRVATGLYNNFHKNNFQQRTQPDTLSAGSSIIYFNQKANSDAIFNMKFLYNKSFNTMKALNWYLGAGFQFRWHDIKYDYIYQTVTYQSELRSFSLASYTYGPSVTTGIEFTHPDIAISSFFEMELYHDLLAYPGWMRVSGGVGVRYNF